jgi:hypothetical protein
MKWWSLWYWTGTNDLYIVISAKVVSMLAKGSGSSCAKYDSVANPLEEALIDRQFHAS